MILYDISNKENWDAFLQYKIEVQHLPKTEQLALNTFIEEEQFVSLSSAWRNNTFPASHPQKHTINKSMSDKKRVVYSFESSENIMLKFIAWSLYGYDTCFCNNCYAFRRNYGVKDALNRMLRHKEISSSYCLKADIHNYFNSIDVNMLVDKLSFIKDSDEPLYNLFSKMLLNDTVSYNGELIHENHGAMAGTPVSPFFANIYLAEVDKYYEDNNILYFRYSDDILIFADTMEELNEYKEILYDFLSKLNLTINPDKLAIYNPGETIDFLGFGYCNETIDLSASTIVKTKAKIKRKAHSLRRWAIKKDLLMEKAAIGFINTMNYKFYGGDPLYRNDDDFTWSRWFFPNITTDTSLKLLDAYMQEYIRYIFTGRHYKGNYRITYSTLKKLGYLSLVNEYYK